MGHASIGDLVIEGALHEIAQLEKGGMRVSGRIARAVGTCEHNRRYLETKRARAGHLSEVEAGEGAA